MKEPERILLVRTSHLGDVVHALPVYHALRQCHPRAELGWVIQAEFAELVRPLPGLARVFLFGRRDGWRAWPRLRSELRRFAPDLAVDAQGGIKSAAATWLSGAPRRVGLARSDWREPAGAVVLNERAPAVRPHAPGATVHAMDRMLALARHLGERAGVRVEPRTDPALDAGELARGEERLARELGPAPGTSPDAGGGAPVVLHLAREGDVRSWPAERFAELARRLVEAGRSVLVLSGPGEAELGRRLADELGAPAGLSHAIGQSGLRELAALFTAAAGRGGRLVACDSGPAHLAAACGLSVTVLAGPQDAARTGPWPVPGRAPAGPHAVLRASAPPACAPCFSARCTHERGPVCMRDIAAADVLHALGG